MKSLTKEIDFADLKNNFDKICDDVNNLFQTVDKKELLLHEISFVNATAPLF